MGKIHLDAVHALHWDRNIRHCSQSSWFIITYAGPDYFMLGLDNLFNSILRLPCEIIELNYDSFITMQGISNQQWDDTDCIAASMFVVIYASISRLVSHSVSRCYSHRHIRYTFSSLAHIIPHSGTISLTLPHTHASICGGIAMCLSNIDRMNDREPHNLLAPVAAHVLHMYMFHRNWYMPMPRANVSRLHATKPVLFLLLAFCTTTGALTFSATCPEWAIVAAVDPACIWIGTLYGALAKQHFGAHRITSNKKKPTVCWLIRNFKMSRPTTKEK